MGFRVQGLRFRVYGPGFRVQGLDPVLGSGLRVQGGLGICRAILILHGFPLRSL